MVCSLHARQRRTQLPSLTVTSRVTEEQWRQVKGTLSPSSSFTVIRLLYLGRSGPGDEFIENVHNPPSIHRSSFLSTAWAVLLSRSTTCCDSIKSSIRCSPGNRRRTLRTP